MRTHFDDCAGIGGFSLAASWNGIETRWAREIDDYARAVYSKHFPSVTLFRDVHDPLPTDLARHVWLYTCGFPCQPVSCAGRRRGRDDERWLWPYVAATIRHLRPTWCLLENVPGLRTLGADEVLADLEGEGYACWAGVVGAVHAGAPHRRQRVWIVAYANNPAAPRQQQYSGALLPEPEPEGPNVGGSDVARPHPPRPWERGDVAYTAGAVGQWIGTITGGQQGGPTDPNWWLVEPNVGRVVARVPARVDRLRCLGNAIVPQVAAEIIAAIVAYDNGGVR